MLGELERLALADRTVPLGILARRCSIDNTGFGTMEHSVAVGALLALILWPRPGYSPPGNFDFWTLWDPAVKVPANYELTVIAIVGVILFGGMHLVSSRLEAKPLPVSQRIGVPAPFKAPPEAAR